MTEVFDYYKSYNDRLSESTFNGLIEQVSNMEFTEENPAKFNCVTNTIMMSALSTACMIEGYKPFDEIISDDVTVTTISRDIGDYRLRSHDISLREQSETDSISFIDFYKIFRKYNINCDRVLTLSYSRKMFMINIVECDVNDAVYFEKEYRKGNFAVYFIPNNIARKAGKCSANYRDILREYNEHLYNHGFIICGKHIEGVVHTVTINDKKDIIRKLRTANNALHNMYRADK